MSKQMLGSKPIKIYFHFGPQTFYQFIWLLLMQLFNFRDRKSLKQCLTFL